MHGSAVATNVYIGSRDERSQFRQIEIAEVGDSVGEGAELSARGVGNCLCRLRVRRPGRQHDAPPRIAPPEGDNQLLK